MDIPFSDIIYFFNVSRSFKNMCHHHDNTLVLLNGCHSIENLGWWPWQCAK